jgi:nucleotide-binding universal stress UspA family protein
MEVIHMKVVIAVDGSKHAEDAARFLAKLPHGEHLELNIVAVNYAPGIHSTVEIIGSTENYLNASRAQLDATCKKIKAMFDGADATVKTTILDGHPGETLANLASGKEVDLLVIGAVGHSTFDRILIGSVSDFVATHATCSVLVVRPGLADTFAHQKRFNVCYAYDDSRPSKNAIDTLGRFLWQPNTDIDVVSVIRSAQIYSDIPITLDTSALRARAMEEIERGAKLASIVSASPATHIVESDHVGDGIVKFATKQKSDLVLLGDTGRGIVSRFFLGSVSRYVLRHAPCSVWIGRNRS